MTRPDLIAEAALILDGHPGALPESIYPVLAVALNAPPAPFVPKQHHFAPGSALLLVGFGSAEEHAQAVALIRAACPPLFEFITPILYTALQQMLDDSPFPWGIRAYEKALYLDELSDEAINMLVERATDKTSPTSFMPIFRLDGAFTQMGEQDTAFGGTRTPQYVVNIIAPSPDPTALAGDRNWVRSVWDALRPLAARAGGYVNFLGEQGDLRATYGSTKYDRLALIKTRYDPGNVFHRNATSSLPNLHTNSAQAEQRFPFRVVINRWLPASWLPVLGSSARHCCGGRTALPRRTGQAWRQQCVAG